PMRAAVTSRAPLVSRASSMCWAAFSVSRALTGRLRNASFRLALTLAGSYSQRLPLRLTTTGICSSARSYVVKRRSQAAQRLRRRIESPSSDARVSTTWVSACLQKGHFTIPTRTNQTRSSTFSGQAYEGSAAVDRELLGQLIDTFAHAGNVGRVARVVQNVGDEIGRQNSLGLAETAGRHGRRTQTDAAGDEGLFRVI